MLIHALCDAMLGAAGLGDIGRHFPDNDPKFKNVNSRALLKEVKHLVDQAGYSLINADITVIDPEQNFIFQEQDILSKSKNSPTTTEGLGFSGRGEGIAAMAVVLVSRD